ncbi:hypothetical protein pb186bvf_013244 [Paramecium bursaria]
MKVKSHLDQLIEVLQQENVEQAQKMIESLAKSPTRVRELAVKNIQIPPKIKSIQEISIQKLDIKEESFQPNLEKQKDIQINIQKIKTSDPDPKQNNIIDIDKLIGTIKQNIQQFNNDTITLQSMIEYTHEIQTTIALRQKTIDLDSPALVRKSRNQNQLFQGFHQKLSDRDFELIQRNFAMKRLIIQAKKEYRKLHTDIDQVPQKLFLNK